MSRPLLVSIPHSGEKIPPEALWLQDLPETTLMRDVDRFVDRLYEPVLKELGIPHLVAPWHRYAGDLNRFAEDVDEDSVAGHVNPKGSHPRGFHWSVTTLGEPLIKSPMTPENHKQLVDRIYTPFHEELNRMAEELKGVHQVVYHLDAHSMPSAGTSMHADPGEQRAEVVISDQKGKSSRGEFLELVVSSYKRAGFQVAINWPYVGGRITQAYGRPDQAHHTLQIELNRRLYMDESTKQLIPEYQKVQDQLHQAIAMVYEGVKQLK